ncbi:hypothetical protein L9F63_005249 [Diploptera punctata]|uniref:N-acetyltransferase domain-containing protein n=1 Tax=Diploptera punctata TaxID=6984 RepID=A0AAD7ZDU4_DIPPU|nr:hypothetical protein L9F63_005249 [Diploptera punctata]
MALDGSTVVGSCLNTPLTRDDVFSYDETASNLYEDKAMFHIELLCKLVHKELDLFTKLNVNQMFEIGWLSVEPSYGGKGLATRLVRNSLELGAQNNFEFAKVDCTGPASAAASKKAGMQEVIKLSYDDYKIDGNIVFKKTPNRASHLTVLVCRLQNSHPYVLPTIQS